jgi:hypothetical protein
MVLKYEMRITIENESIGSKNSSALAHPFHFGHEHRRIQHDPGAQKTAHVGTQNSARQKAESGFDPIDDDCMTCIVAALETHDPIGVLSEDIDDLSLTFVSPLGTYDNDRWHMYVTFDVFESTA